MPNGLLAVNPHGAHPIFELIRSAEHEWNAKLARASRTLQEAVAEYERRYDRAPPLGFDKWWDYVVKHDVQLPDEYDEIYHDIEPFWGLDPRDLAQTLASLETEVDVITVAKTPQSSKLEIVNTTLGGDHEGPFRRINDILNLVADVQHQLPPMRITFSHHDNPNMFSHWAIKNMALEAARNGTTIRQSDLPQVHKLGWTEACSPDSPARRNPPSIPSTSFQRLARHPDVSKTFIASHRATMDPCMHPELLVTHGQFLSYNVGPYPRGTLIPRFSHCATLLHHDIRPPIPYGWLSESALEKGGDVPWSQKVDGRLNWRGSTTGIYASPDKAWSYAQRFRLVAVANAFEGNMGVLRATKDERERVEETEEMELARVNPAWMDVAFAGKAIGCDEVNGSCKEIEEAWEFKKTQEKEEEGRYKFIIDVDGNGWSGRFQRLMSSNSLIFKATVYPEWYTSRIAPWVHYVPVQISYADLYDTLAFFREHDAAAERIAREGKEWSRNFWRKEDMAAYLYRLLLEYARVSSLDREAMSYRG